MRKITSGNPNTVIEITDEPGAGGANHRYQVLSSTESESQPTTIYADIHKKSTIIVLSVAAAIFALAFCCLAQAGTTCQPPVLADNQLMVECRSDRLNTMTHTGNMDNNTITEVWRDIYGIADGKLTKIKTIRAKYAPSHRVDEEIVWPDGTDELSMDELNKLSESSYDAGSFKYFDE